MDIPQDLILRDVRCFQGEQFRTTSRTMNRPCAIARISIRTIRTCWRWPGSRAYVFSIPATASSWTTSRTRNSSTVHGARSTRARPTPTSLPGRHARSPDRRPRPSCRPRSERAASTAVWPRTILAAVAANLRACHRPRTAATLPRPEPSDADRPTRRASAPHPHQVGRTARRHGGASRPAPRPSRSGLGQRTRALPRPPVDRGHEPVDSTQLPDVLTAGVPAARGDPGPARPRWARGGTRCMGSLTATPCSSCSTSSGQSGPPTTAHERTAHAVAGPPVPRDSAERNARRPYNRGAGRPHALARPAATAGRPARRADGG